MDGWRWRRETRAVRFTPTELTPAELELQAEVRDFLAAEMPRGSYEPALGMGADHDKEFSKKLAAKGWVGMALPKRYGGHDRSAVDRFIVVEELLALGCADRLPLGGRPPDRLGHQQIRHRRTT